MLLYIIHIIHIMHRLFVCGIHKALCRVCLLVFGCYLAARESSSYFLKFYKEFPPDKSMTEMPNKLADYAGISEIVGPSGLRAQIGGEDRTAAANRPGGFGRVSHQSLIWGDFGTFGEILAHFTSTKRSMSCSKLLHCT